jgi:hypothetical protein
VLGIDIPSQSRFRDQTIRAEWARTAREKFWTPEEESLEAMMLPVPHYLEECRNFRRLIIPVVSTRHNMDREHSRRQRHLNLSIHNGYQ